MYICTYAHIMSRETHICKHYKQNPICQQLTTYVHMYVLNDFRNKLTCTVAIKVHHILIPVSKATYACTHHELQ